MKFVLQLLLITIIITSCKDQNTIKGDKLFESGNYKEAIIVYDEFLKLNPTDIKSLYNRGRSYEELGDFQSALKDFNEVLLVDSKNTQAMLSIATFHYRNEAYDQAAYFAERAIEENSQLSKAFFWLGRSNYQLGKFKEAMQALHSAINLNKSYGEAYLYRGILHLRQQNNKGACADFKSAASLDISDAKEAVKKYCQ